MSAGKLPKGASNNNCFNCHLLEVRISVVVGPGSDFLQAVEMSSKSPRLYKSFIGKNCMAIYGIVLLARCKRIEAAPAASILYITPNTINNA